MKIIAIIQARMGSTRLHGKILKRVMGKTLLEYQLERVQQSIRIDEIVVATTNMVQDDSIVSLCEQLGIRIYRGSESDVLSRYYEASVKFSADTIVRLTSDCPLIEPKVIDEVIQLYLDQYKEIDYVSNTLERTFPRGLDTEVFSFNALERTYERASLPRDREHVTAFMYTNPSEFHVENHACESNYGDHRWTVDTEEDFELIKRILESIYPTNPKFSMQDVIQLLNENPTWVDINSHIEQKKL